MPYDRACEVLNNPRATLEKLLEAYADICMEFGNCAAIGRNRRQKNEIRADLIRLMTVKQALQFRINSKFKQSNQNYSKKMLNPTATTKILNYCKRQGYPIKNFNIIYIEGLDIDGRLNTDEPNQFNDVRCIFNSERCIDIWDATCEPGSLYTHQPMNAAGAFRIAFGYHKNGWEIGWHGNSDPHEALVQVGEVKGYRDYNRDMIRSGDAEVVGCFGINQHWGYDLPWDDIDAASAGCLVGRTRGGHRQFMDYCKDSGLRLFSTIVLPGNEIFK
jgi:hypothetical protein